MNRETKIGLLVGLAFIIVVAILLTDHTTTTTDPRPAALPEVGNNVRQSVTTPAPPTDNTRPQVPTRADLAKTPVEPVKPPVKIVQVGPETPDSPIAIGPAPQIDPTTQMPVMKPVTSKPAKPDLVAQHPDELTRVDGPGAANRTTPPAIVPPKTYVAQAGDSVNRIAARNMPGGNTKTNRDALIKANPTMQADGNPVVIGKTYIIPSAGAIAQISDSAKRPAVPTFVKPAPTPANVTWYTVKENDNLWRIAASELGDGNRWQQIKDMNKDLLNGGETVKANQRIRLPRGSTSTASVE
jgi:LysM repeat protein